MNSTENKENVSCNYVKTYSLDNQMETVADVNKLLSGNCHNLDKIAQICNKDSVNVLHKLEDRGSVVTRSGDSTESALNGSVCKTDSDTFIRGYKNIDNMPMIQPSKPKQCDCGVRKPRPPPLNLGKIKSHGRPMGVYANGEPMEMDDICSELNTLHNLDKHQQQYNGKTLKKWDSFEVLENWCEKSLLESEKGGINENGHGENVNYFKDLIEYVEENGMDICTDKEGNADLESNADEDGVFQLHKADSFEMLEQWCDKKVKSERNSSAASSNIEEDTEDTVAFGNNGISCAVPHCNSGKGSIEKSSVTLEEAGIVTQNHMNGHFVNQKTVGESEDHSEMVSGVNCVEASLGTSELCENSFTNGYGNGSDKDVDKKGAEECKVMEGQSTPEDLVEADGTCQLMQGGEMLKTENLKDIPDIQISPVSETSNADELHTSGNATDCNPSNLLQIQHNTPHGPKPTKASNNTKISSPPKCCHCSSSHKAVISMFQPLVFKETNFIPSPRFLGSPSVPDIPRSLSVLNESNDVDDSDSDASKSTNYSSPVSRGELSEVPSLKTGSYNSLNSFSSDFSDLSKDMSQSMVFQEPNFSRGVLKTSHVRNSRNVSSTQSPSSSKASRSCDKCTKSSDWSNGQKRASKREIVDNDASLNELSHKLQKLSMEQSNQSPSRFKGAVSSLKQKGLFNVKDRKSKDTKQTSSPPSPSVSGRLTPVKKPTNRTIPVAKPRPFSPLTGSPLMSRSTKVLSSMQADSSPSRNKGLPVGQVFKKLTSESVGHNNTKLQKCESSPSLYNNNNRGASPLNNRGVSPLHRARKTGKKQLLNRQATPRYAERQRAVGFNQDQVPTLNFDDTDSTTTDDTDISEVQVVPLEKQKQQSHNLRQEKQKLHKKLCAQETGSPRCCSPAPSSPLSPVDDFTCVRFKDAEAVSLRGPELEAVTKLYTLCNGQQQAKIIKQATAPMIFSATVYEEKEACHVKWAEDGQMVTMDQPSVLHNPLETGLAENIKPILRPNGAMSPFPYFDEPFLPVVVRKLPKKSTAQIDPSKM